MRKPKPQSNEIFRNLYDPKNRILAFPYAFFITTLRYFFLFNDGFLKQFQ